MHIRLTHQAKQVDTPTKDLLNAMPNGFDVAPVRIEHEGTVIMLVILGSQAGLAFRPSTIFESNSKETPDLLAVAGRESDMSVPCD